MFLVPYQQLSNQQKGIIQRVSRGFDNLFVEGPAGTGKTLISLYAVRDIVNNQTVRPLVLMYNHSLYGYLKKSFNELGIYDNITIDTKDSFFWNLANNNNVYVPDEGPYKTKYNVLLDGLLKANLTQKWPIAVVDEIQDFTYKEWKILKTIAGKIISMGDFNQRVYNTDLEKQDITYTSQLEKLSDIFRFHKNIAKVARVFNKNNDHIEYNVTKIEQKQPKIIDARNRYEETREVVNVLKALKNHQKNIGIISADKKRLAELKEELAGYGIETTFYTNNRDFRQHDFTSKTPLLLSAHSAKGLEFENVIVLGFYNTLNDWYNRDLDELIYVSLTRANSGLFIIRTPDTIEKLRGLKIEEEKKQEVSIDDLFG
jgi:superfamily I DNA/RNA helicase